MTGDLERPGESPSALRGVHGEKGAAGPGRPPSRPVLETRRLLIRPPVATDAAALALIADNPRIAQNLTRMPHPYGVADAEAFIAEDCPADGLKHLILRKRGDDAPELVGALALDHRRGPIPELGYWIAEPCWNRGYATEAAHAAIDFAFLVHRHPRVNVTCRVTNGASRRVIEKCGFQHTGQDLSPSSFFKAVVAIDRFSLDRRAWESLRRWGGVEVRDDPERAEPAPGNRGRRDVVLDGA
ncbi:GNAT family N-acetyltransferase [Methylobrevis albus]|uniref:GNAT family N-acetyltransferase n=1 Tax=Methylobrevis albus TaxID=2793297 RepID=A0A931MWU2_9HYPH|nr:GNAT family protein [Methylobrevis albus]MBH0237833.1 GNAT family N-acetyltransferase [Methylobrevis albus]